MADRIDAIRAMLENSPEDVMLHYSLGMEYASAGRHDEAIAAFRRCQALDADYLPGYVEEGKCLRSAGRLEEARRAFAAAMEMAAMQGKTHVRDFVQQQLDGLGRQ